MNKIKTIFERDWNGNKKVIDKYMVNIEELKGAIATEKIDGTNVRITIRNNTFVRAERRCNPSKFQKKQGITEPWYVDADEFSPNDKYIFDGLKNTKLNDIPDGEWSGELVGKNIQGNPLNLENNKIMFFTLNEAPIFEDAPITFNELKEWLPNQKSKYGNNCGIEGLVWWKNGEHIGKIKCKDFKFY